MIESSPRTYIIKTSFLAETAAWIEHSGAPQLIEQFYEEQRGQGGRPAAQKFTLLGYLTVTAVLISMGRVASIAEVHRVITEMTAEQLDLLGMDARVKKSTYAAFEAWITRRVVPIDPGKDLPARRITNREHRAIVAQRSAQDIADSELAEDRLHTVINLLVAGSIEEAHPTGGAGDVVVDETIIDLAGASATIGSKPDKLRAASYAGAFYARAKTDNRVLAEGEQERIVIKSVSKMGFAVGMTAVARIGAGVDLYSIPPVITGIAIHPPTSASVAGMRDALSAHQLNGFDQRTKGGKLPNLTVDMGYNSKDGFTDSCMDLGYAPVVRYPKHWNTVWASDSTAHTVRGVPAGPAQIAGDFYCPAAAQLTDGKKLVRKTTEMLSETAGFDNHERNLQRLLPFLMGTNSRPYKASRPGRPKTVDPDREEGMRIDLVCPAVQGRVRCPLKPESLVKDTELAPTVTPTWTADRYRCCANSQVTVAYSKDQWRMAAWGMTPGTWEHTVYFEAARALNEQRFSILKSMHVTGSSDLKWAARREPFVKIIIALMVASANKRIQNRWKQHPPRASSITMRMKQLEASLGRTPMKRPPRT